MGASTEALCHDRRGSKSTKDGQRDEQVLVQALNLKALTQTPKIGGKTIDPQQRCDAYCPVEPAKP